MQHNKGFTIVELMLSMTLAMLVMIGMYTVFSGSRESGLLQTAVANTGDAARAALDFMGRSIQQAGLTEDPLDSLSAIDSASTTDGGDKKWTGKGLNFATDAIALEYDADTNCAGQTVTRVRNVFSVVDETLVCDTEDDSGTATQVTLLEGVEDLQFLYGEDRLEGDGEAVATAYVRADEVSDWTRVVGVDVAIQVASTREVTGVEAARMQERFDLLLQGGYPQAADKIEEDERFRIALSSRFGIRNQSGVR